MALVRCPDCGHEISTKAKMCPSCGAPVASTGKLDTSIAGNAKGCLSLVVLAMLVLFVISLLTDGGGDDGGTSAPSPQPAAGPSEAAPRAAAPEPVTVEKSWRLVGSQGLMNFVYVDQAHSRDEDQYRFAIAEVCAGKNICQVLFWNDIASTPRQLPMTDGQLASQVAHWQYNGNTGLRRLLWSCKIVNNPSECF